MGPTGKAQWVLHKVISSRSLNSHGLTGCPSAAKHLMHQMVCPNLVVQGPVAEPLQKARMWQYVRLCVARWVCRYVCKYVGMCVICMDPWSICMHVCTHVCTLRMHACQGTFHSGHLVRECVCFVVMWIFWWSLQQVVPSALALKKNCSLALILDGSGRHDPLECETNMEFSV